MDVNKCSMEFRDAATEDSLQDHLFDEDEDDQPGADVWFSTSTENSRPNQAHSSMLFNGIRESWLSTKYTDMKIYTQDQTLDCHRLVLAGASPFLRHLLQDVEEALLHLPGTSGDKLQQVLQMLYTGNMEDRDEAADELLDLLHIPLNVCDEKSGFESGPDVNLKMYLPPSCPVQFHRKRMELTGLEDGEENDLGFNEHLDIDPQLDTDEFTCVKCDEMFTSDFGLKQHMNIHVEKSEKQTSHTCPSCSKSFRWRSEYRKHAEKEHGFKVVEVRRCELCNKDIVCARYRDHVKTVHRKERPFTCDVCKKSFAKPKDLKNHKRIHTGDKPYVCNKCGAKFTISHLLLRHMRYHDGVTKYPCSECNKAFMQKNDLTKHMRIHTGEKPFKCDECGNAFARNDYLKKHKHLHQNSEGFECDTCKITFSTKDSLRKHKMASHKTKDSSLSKSSQGISDKFSDSLGGKPFMYLIRESSESHRESSTGLVIPSSLVISSLPFTSSPIINSPLLSAAAGPAPDPEILSVESDAIILQESSSDDGRIALSEDPDPSDGGARRRSIQPDGRIILPESAADNQYILPDGEDEAGGHEDGLVVQWC